VPEHERDYKRDVKKLQKNFNLTRLEAERTLHAGQVALMEDFGLSHWNRDIDELISWAQLRATEANWDKRGRPYYRLWPKIIPIFEKLNFSEFQVKDFLLETPPVEVQLPLNTYFNVKHSTGETVCLCAVLFQITGDKPEVYPICNHKLEYYCDGKRATNSLLMNIQYCHLDGRIAGTPLPTYGPFHEDITMEKWVRKYVVESPTSTGENCPADLAEVYTRLLKMLCMITLLKQDSELLELVKPDDAPLLTGSQQRLLNKDITAFIARFPKLARKLGLVKDGKGRTGWDVGRNVEVMPHWRNPGVAVQVHGPRNSLRKLIIRSGTFVHKDKIDEVPLGEHGQDDGE
jgi:hypothetical protein